MKESGMHLVKVLPPTLLPACLPQILAFMYVAATSCLIIASRKHYTVDITVAW